LERIGEGWMLGKSFSKSQMLLHKEVFVKVSTNRLK
jgi:hypothetical protein